MADGTTTYGDVNQRTTALAPGAKRRSSKKAPMGKTSAPAQPSGLNEVRKPAKRGML